MKRTETQRMFALFLVLIMLLGVNPMGYAADVPEEENPTSDPTIVESDRKISDGNAVSSLKEYTDLELEDLYFTNREIKVDLTRDKYTLEPEFNPDIREYTMLVPDGVTAYGLWNDRRNRNRSLADHQ